MGANVKYFVYSILEHENKSKGKPHGSNTSRKLREQSQRLQRLSTQQLQIINKGTLALFQKSTCMIFKSSKGAMEQAP